MLGDLGVTMLLFLFTIEQILLSNLCSHLQTALTEKAALNSLTRKTSPS